MITSENAAIAIEVVKEIAGDPETGVIKDLLDAIEKSVAPVKEVRVVTAKENR